MSQKTLALLRFPRRISPTQDGLAPASVKTVKRLQNSRGLISDQRSNLLQRPVDKFTINDDAGSA